MDTVQGGVFGGGGSRVGNIPRAHVSIPVMARQPQRDSPASAAPPLLQGLTPSGRTRLGGEATRVLEFKLRTVTPVYGGGARLPHAALDKGPDGKPVARPERLDARVAVRAASVAAQIRAWWRILAAVAPACRTAADLRARESALWGSVHAGTPRRSQVDVWVTHIHGGKIDTSPADDWRGYALWPARPVSDEMRDKAKGDKDKDDKTPWAPRWKHGLSFTLHLRVPKPEASDVERAVRAWVLFGGYGSRTRRGCGALTAPDADWLPAEATLAAIEAALGLDPGTLSATVGDPPMAREIPALHGSQFALGQGTHDDAMHAWKVALHWLRDFRQERGDSEWHARGQGSGNKPGRSRWPEPDKIRQLGLHDDQHTARYLRQPAWPRAVLGLPIVFSAWNNSLSLIWRRGSAPFERLASPLIVKPLPLAGDCFAPLALWLHRDDPKGGHVVLSKGKHHGEHDIHDKSAAPFGRLLGDGDEPRFEPLRVATTLREAFFAWLHKRHEDVTVSP